MTAKLIDIKITENIRRKRLPSLSTRTVDVSDERTANTPTIIVAVVGATELPEPLNMSTV